MTNLKTFCGTTALCSIVIASPVLADLTSKQVWDDFSGYIESFGYSLTATESMSGGTLTVSDVLMSMDLPEGEGTFGFGMETLTFSDAGNGTVSIVFPPVMPITVNVTPKDGSEAVEVTIDYTQTGLEMLVSGDPDALVYDFSADQIGMVLSDLKVDGEMLGRNVARMDITMSDVSGKTTVTNGDMREIDQSMIATTVAYDMAFNSPDSNESALISGGMENMRFDGVSVVPLELDAADMGKMLMAGFSLDGGFAYENGKAQFAITDAGNTTSGTTATDSADLDIVMSEAALTYAGKSTGTKIDMAGGELPLPISAEMGVSAFNLTMPLSPTDDPQDVALGVTLGDFTMSDLLWNIFDPGKVLPRDPATVSFDLIGQAKLFMNLMDPEQMAKVETEGAIPGELNALTLRDLVVQAAGAKVTGTGDFTFDNSDLETFDGMPKPTGAIDLEVAGANGLIDKLIQMGLLKEQDAMGARMMMGMFTVPGEGEDNLKSKLEINDQGHVLANGQRIK